MASNISISKTHIEKFFQEEDLDNIPLSTEITLYNKYKYAFISEVVSILYLHSEKDISDQLHKIITLLIQIPDEEYEKEEFKKTHWDLKPDSKIKRKEGLHIQIPDDFDYEINDYLTLLKQVRCLMSCCKKIGEKGELCKLERRLMVIYLNQLNH